MKQVFMRKSAFHRAEVRCVDVPAPRASAGSVVVRVRHSLISAGTETAAVRSTKAQMVKKALRDPDIRQSVWEMLTDRGLASTAERVRYEFTKWTPLGYSGAGTAIAVGSEVDRVRVGDLVAYGGHPHAELARVPKNLCVPVPAELSTEEAAFVAVGSIALHAVRQAEIQIGDLVAVIGLGLVGQLVCQIARVAGAHVMGVDPLESRRNLALTLGCEWASEHGKPAIETVRSLTGAAGADRVIVCASGGSQPLYDAVEMARDRARVVVVGGVDMHVPREPFYKKELTLAISRSYGPGRYDPAYEEKGIDYPIGYVRWTERRNMAEFLSLVASGRVNVKSLVTHVLPVDRANEAYALLTENPQETLAVLLEYPETEPSSLQHVYSLPARRRVSATNREYVNVAVVGCGAFAREMHLPLLRQAKDFRIRYVVSSRGQSAREAAELYGAERCATDVDEVFSDPEVDAVFILTRDASHAALAARALAAGKHVYCEKPLAVSLEQCDLLERTASESDRLCVVGFNRRFAPMMEVAKDYVDRCPGPKMLLYRVNAGPQPADHWVYDPDQAAGRIIGEACHFVDLFRWMLGCEPVDVVATALDGDRPLTKVEDLSVVFQFADGSVATLLYTARGTRLAGKERFEAFAAGTTIVVDDFKRLTVRGAWRISKRSRVIDKGHRRCVEAFGRAVRGATVHLPTERDGIAATLWCVRALECALGVRLERKDNSTS